MSKSNLQVLARRSSKGAYDFSREDKVVTDLKTGRVFAVIDVWCADELGSYCYRSEVYSVPPAAVASVIRDVNESDVETAGGDDYDDSEVIVSRIHDRIIRQTVNVYSPLVAGPFSRRYAAIRKA